MSRLVRSNEHGTFKARGLRGIVRSSFWHSSLLLSDLMFFAVNGDILLTGQFLCTLLKRRFGQTAVQADTANCTAEDRSDTVVRAVGATEVLCQRRN